MVHLAPALAFGLPLQDLGDKGFAVIKFNNHAPRVPMRPHALVSKTPPNKSGCTSEPIEVGHIARRVDAAKMHALMAQASIWCFARH